MAVALFSVRRVTHQSGRMILALFKSGQRLIGYHVTPLPSAAATRVVPRYSVCGPRCRDCYELRDDVYRELTVGAEQETVAGAGMSSFTSTFDCHRLSARAFFRRSRKAPAQHFVG